MITLYGIKNCDTVKKARRWLDEQQLEYQFHDFRQDGLTKKQLKEWISELGWEDLVNKRSTSWKNLDEAIKSTLNDRSSVDIIFSMPTLIKRPLLDNGTSKTLGFTLNTYEKLLLDNK